MMLLLYGVQTCWSICTKRCLTLVQTIRSSDEHMNKYALVEAVVTQLVGFVTNGFII
ncbi:hypothetical protein ECO26H__p60019 [Escherichia coli O26:H11]|nr:hypothetical protein ECO26H__p60019 [Escherichia coli O26:H11]